MHFDLYTDTILGMHFDLYTDTILGMHFYLYTDTSFRDAFWFIYWYYF